MSAAADSDAEFDARYEAFFNRADIDGWEIRKVSKNLYSLLLTLTLSLDTLKSHLV